MWYRAQVRNATKEKITVVFVDFGNEEAYDRSTWTQTARCPGGFMTERPMCMLPFWDSSLNDNVDEIEAFLGERAESKITFVPELNHSGSYTDEVAMGQVFVDDVP